MKLYQLGASAALLSLGMGSSLTAHAGGWSEGTPAVTSIDTTAPLGEQSTTDIGPGSVLLTIWGNGFNYNVTVNFAQQF